MVFHETSCVVALPKNLSDSKMRLARKRMRMVVDNIQNTNKCINLPYSCVADVDSQSV